MSSRWMMTAAAACASLVLAACIPSLPDDAELYFGRSSGSIPISEGQTTEVHIRDTLPRYLGIIEEVVVESGGVLGVSGKNRVDGCATADTTDMEIQWMTMYIPAIDYEDLRRMVVEGRSVTASDIRGIRYAEINSTFALLLSGMATGIV